MLTSSLLKNTRIRSGTKHRNRFLCSRSCAGTQLMYAAYVRTSWVPVNAKTTGALSMFPNDMTSRRLSYGTPQRPVALSSAVTTTSPRGLSSLSIIHHCELPVLGGIRSDNIPCDGWYNVWGCLGQMSLREPGG